jgi:hypothetical protein
MRDLYPATVMSPKLLRRETKDCHNLATCENGNLFTASDK